MSLSEDAPCSVLYHPTSTIMLLLLWISSGFSVCFWSYMFSLILFLCVFPLIFPPPFNETLSFSSQFLFFSEGTHQGDTLFAVFFFWLSLFGFEVGIFWWNSGTPVSFLLEVVGINCAWFYFDKPVPFSNLLVWTPFFDPGYVLLSQNTLLESVESVVHESVCVCWIARWMNTLNPYWLLRGCLSNINVCMYYKDCHIHFIPPLSLLPFLPFNINLFSFLFLQSSLSLACVCVCWVLIDKVWSDNFFTFTNYRCCCESWWVLYLFSFFCLFSFILFLLCISLLHSNTHY